MTDIYLHGTTFIDACPLIRTSLLVRTTARQDAEPVGISGQQSCFESFNQKTIQRIIY